MDEQTLRWSSSAQAAQSNTLAGAQAKQRQQQYHDNNNNSNSNNGKVKLLITPATESYGSKQQQQQMERSTAAIITTTTATLTTIDNTQQHQQHRSQQQQNNRQKNYHHYDYYTDSDLASSLLDRSTSNNNNNNNNVGYNSSSNNNYDQNILLFATEHNNTGQQQQYRQQPQQQALTNSSSNNNNKASRHLAYSQLIEAHNRNSPYYSSQLNSGGSQLYSGGSTVTGKFINHYPSWRQTQSPTTNPNYSFHVPLHSHHHNRRHNNHHHLHSSNSNNNNQPSRPQSRYGYLAPGDRAKLSSRSSFKSRTLAHLPQHSAGDCDLNERRAKQEVDDCGDEVEEEEEINYYDRPSLSTKQFMLSEGDLLKVRSVVLDDGPENPFKPGTELSWEAEMMVRLMKRGYPIQELPVLVQTAKQVARESNKVNLQQQQEEDVAGAELTNLSGTHKNDAITRNGNLELDSASKRRSREMQRRRSSHDLSQVKQVWASSLSRAKSMPRFLSSSGVNKPQTDADSIDMLIESIQLMAADDDDDDDNDESQGAISEAVNNQQQVNDSQQKPKSPIKTAKQQRKSSQQQQEARKSIESTADFATASSASLMTMTKTKTNNNNGNKKKRASSEQQANTQVRQRQQSNRKLLAKQSPSSKQHNQLASNKADLKQIKKRNKTNCCTIQ